MSILLYCYVMPCNNILHRRFGRLCCLHRQGWWLTAEDAGRRILRNMEKVCEIKQRHIATQVNFQTYNHQNLRLDLVEILFCSIWGKGKGKAKVHPRTGHEGPEGEWSYSSTLCLTSALDRVGGQGHAPAALPPRKTRYQSWVGPRPGTDGCGKSHPHRDSTPGQSNP